MVRVYILINVKSGTAENVVQSLQKQPGVLLADMVERPPDIIMVVQAANQESLLECTVNALLPVENQIEGLQLLPKLEGVYALEMPLTYRRN